MCLVVCGKMGSFFGKLTRGHLKRNELIGVLIIEDEPGVRAAPGEYKKETTSNI